jgi:hypothetical protein
MAPGLRENPTITGVAEGYAALMARVAGPAGIALARAACSG